MTGTFRRGSRRAPAAVVLSLCLVAAWGCSERSEKDGQSQERPKAATTGGQAKGAIDKPGGQDTPSQADSPGGQGRPLFSVSGQSPVGTIPEPASKTGVGPEAAPQPAAAVEPPPATKPRPAGVPERTPEQKARSFVELARNYLNAGRPDRAADFLNRVLAEYPKTQAAAQAREMLDEMQKKAGQSGDSR